MRVLVSGDRNWQDEDMIWRVLDHLGPSLVIEGHARGADRCAHHWAVAHGVQLVCEPADWARYGRGAGPIRNGKMLLHEPDLVLAFHDNIEESKGTGNMLMQTHGAGIDYALLTQKDKL